MICTPYETGDESGCEFKEEVEFHASGQAWCIRDGDELVAIIGGVNMWGTVCVVYAHVRTDIKSSQAFGLIKACYNCLTTLSDLNGYTKFQAFVSADKPTNTRFIELLGFSQEGIMVIGMPDGTDCIIYGRLS